MPWTFAHPAAVLPLAFAARRLRWPVPLAGLVIGSLTPDLAYYFGKFELGRFAHTAAGLVAVCLPSGLLLAFLWHGLRELWLPLVPQPHRGALAALPRGPAPWQWRALPPLAAAVLVGAATHAAWDSLTHEHGVAVQALPLLQLHLFDWGARKFFVFNTLQHASTVAGALCLAAAYAAWLRRQMRVLGAAGGDARQSALFDDDTRDRLRYALWGGCLLAAVVVAVPLAMQAVKAQGPHRLTMIGVHTVILATCAFAVLLFAVALWWRWRWRAPARG